MKSLSENAKKFLPQSDKVLMNPKGYAKMNGLPREEMSIESNAMLWSTGLMASFGDVKVFVDSTVNENEALLFLKTGDVMIVPVAEMLTGCSECGA